MKIYQHAASPSDDSVAYVLINLSECFPSLTDRKFTITYNRLGDFNESTPSIKRELSFDAVDAVHAGLSDALVEIFTNNKTASVLHAPTANCMASFIFGSYVDLQQDSAIATEYRYVTHVHSVRTDDKPDSFVIYCSSFDVLNVSEKGIPQISARLYIQQTLNTAQIESLWVNSSTLVPFMEGLGYKAHEISSELNRARLKSGSSLKPTRPDFDISFD